MFEVIDTGADPSDVPVSEAVHAGGLFWSVHVSEDPVTGEPVFGDIETQARRTLQNLEIAIKAAGGSSQMSCRCRCFSPKEPTLPA